MTADGLAKPEIIAPAMWVAAPILPGTQAYTRAQALARLSRAPDNRLAAMIREIGPETIGLPPSDWPGPDALRAWIDGRLRAEKIISAHYQHVDGTSFAAPIVASVVAQMLEANPDLSPAAVKRILLQTAERVAELPAIRQGYGVLNARAAIDAARRESHLVDAGEAVGPRIESGRLVFTLHDDLAESAAVAASFDGWDPGRHPMERGAAGFWRVEMDVPPPGRHRYKLVLEGQRWVPDPANGRREADPYGGFESILEA